VGAKGAHIMRPHYGPECTHVKDVQKVEYRVIEGADHEFGIYTLNIYLPKGRNVEITKKLIFSKNIQKSKYLKLLSE